MLNLIWTAVVILFILWALGFAVNIGGSLIHLLLVLALIGIVYNLLIGRQSVQILVIRRFLGKKMPALIQRLQPLQGGHCPPLGKLFSRSYLISAQTPFTLPGKYKAGSGAEFISPFESLTMLDIDEMSTEEMTDLLNQVGHGHLGCALNGHPYVVPMHYYFHAPDIYIFTTVAG